jgi:putative ABC transport system substrate-binding protein
MSRKVFVFICLLLAVFLPAVFAEAQQPRKVPRIGYLSAVGAARDSTRAEAIRLALRELGYVEGQNIAIEYRSAGGKLDRYHKHATELVRLKVDIIVVAGGTIYVQAVKNATKTIPIVMKPFLHLPVSRLSMIRPIRAM